MSQTVIRFRAAPVRPRWRDRALLLWRRVLAARAEAATRRQLAALDDRALSDVGISRAQAQFEAERPVWELIPFLHR